MVASRFGLEPADMRLDLTRDAAFRCTLASLDGDWPTDLVAKIQIGVAPYVAEWTGVVSGDEITWSATKTQVADVIEENPSSVRIADTSTDLVWFKGFVVIS